MHVTSDQLLRYMVTNEKLLGYMVASDQLLIYMGHRVSHKYLSMKKIMWYGNS